jgi:hypothetical protein
VPERHILSDYSREVSAGCLDLLRRREYLPETPNPVRKVCAEDRSARTGAELRSDGHRLNEHSVRDFGQQDIHKASQDRGVGHPYAGARLRGSCLTP